jgi:hypothetical protein
LSSLSTGDLSAIGVDRKISERSMSRSGDCWE